MLKASDGLRRGGNEPNPDPEPDPDQVSDFEEVMNKQPPISDLCPPAARVGASAMAWGGAKFLLFGRATG